MLPHIMESMSDIKRDFDPQYKNISRNRCTIFCAPTVNCRHITCQQSNLLIHEAMRRIYWVKRGDLSVSMLIYNLALLVNARF